MREQLNRGVVPDGIDVHCLAGLIKVTIFSPSRSQFFFFSNYIEIYLEVGSMIVGFWSVLLFESCLGEFSNMLMLIFFPFLNQWV